MSKNESLHRFVNGEARGRRGGKIPRRPFEPDLAR